MSAGTDSQQNDDMTGKPLVSIVTPFLNAEEFIRETIESVFAQTFENWELVLVDDGSTDNSTNIARKFAELYPEKIRYLEHNGHRNHGISASINLGISKARGEYFSFLDADDVWLPQYLERSVSILESFPEAAMVYSPAQIWRSWTGNPDDIQRDSIQKLGIKPDRLFMPLTLITHFLQNEGSTPCTGTTMVRRSAIECVGGWETAFPGMYDDQVFYLKICIEAPVYVFSECGFRYRRHPRSMCVIAGKTGDHYTARFAFLKWLETYLYRKRIKNLKVWAILKKELLPYRHPTLHQLMKQKGFKSFISNAIRNATPKPIKRVLKRYLNMLGILKARVRLTLKPQALSTKWGFDRGLPIHRYYLEQFLKEFSSDIHGHCLEFQEDSYTTRFGGAGVTKLDILHIDDSNPKATIVADLTQPNEIPDNSFDCIICTHVLHMIFDFDKAISFLGSVIFPSFT